jgi:hypothetical protein
MPMRRGSCLRGGVKFEINGPLIGPSNCHCSMGRKQHGAAFRSRARVQASDLKWAQGEDLVTFYESSPGTYRFTQRLSSLDGAALVHPSAPLPP